MMTKRLVVLAIVLAAHAMAQFREPQDPEFQAQLRARRVSSPADFAYDFAKPVLRILAPGGTARPSTLDEFPANAGQGMSFTLVDMEPCSINLPHTHPRATEFLFLRKGNNFTIGFVEENGGRATGSVLNQNMVTIFPGGMVHFEQNFGCEPSQFLASFNSDDPGVATSHTAVFKQPDDMVSATFQFKEPNVDAQLRTMKGLQPAGNGPFQGVGECRARCGLPPL